MARLAVFESDPASAARLHDALAFGHDLITFESWTSLLSGLSRERIDGCVIDPFAAKPPVTERELERLRASHPNLAIVGFSEFAQRPMTLARLTPVLDEIIVPAEEDTREEIRAVIARALRGALARRIGALVEGRLPALECDVLVWCIEHAEAGSSVGRLAEVFDTTADHLARTLHREGGLSPRSQLLWGRLFQIGQALTTSNRTNEAVAHELGYADGSSLGRVLRRNLRLTASELRRRTGVSVVFQRYTEARFGGQFPQP